MNISDMFTKKKQLRFVLSVSSIFIKYHCYFLLGSFIRFLFYMFIHILGNSAILFICVLN